MNKIAIVGVIGAICVGGGAFAQYSYDQEITKNIEELKGKLSTEGMDFQFSEKQAYFFDSNIVLKDLVFKSKEFAQPIKVGEFSIDRNSFKVDKNGLHSFVKFSVKNGSFTTPMLNEAETFSLDYFLEYNESNGHFENKMDLDVSNLAAIKLTADFDNTTNIWEYPVKNKDSNGNIKPIGNPEEILALLGDFSINNIHIKLEDRKLISKVSDFFAKFDRNMDATDFRKNMAKQIRKDTVEGFNYAENIAKFVQNSGTLNINIDPDTPLHVNNLVKEIKEAGKKQRLNEKDLMTMIHKASNLKIEYIK